MEEYTNNDGIRWIEKSWSFCFASGELYQFSVRNDRWGNPWVGEVSILHSDPRYYAEMACEDCSGSVHMQSVVQLGVSNEGDIESDTKCLDYTIQYPDYCQFAVVWTKWVLDCLSFDESGPQDRGEMKCEQNGQLITIQSAFYGRSSETECSAGNGNYAAWRYDICDSSHDVTSIVASQCDGLQWCQFHDITFDADPCPGTHYYTKIVYSCIPPPIESTTDWSTSFTTTPEPTTQEPETTTIYYGM